MGRLGLYEFRIFVLFANVEQVLGAICSLQYAQAGRFKYSARFAAAILLRRFSLLCS